MIQKPRNPSLAEIKITLVTLQKSNQLVCETSVQALANKAVELERPSHSAP
jgi:hypothetical protein